MTRKWLLGFVVATAALWSAASASATTTTVGCAWAQQYGMGGSMLLAPDTSSVYWRSGYVQLPKGGLTIDGSFPSGRYMSFTLYQYGAPVSYLYDAQIQPSSGTNPFVAPNTGGGTYEVHIVAGPPPAQPAANTLYTRSSGIGLYQLIYRIYDPSGSTTGGVPLPMSTITYNGRPIISRGACVTTVAAFKALLRVPALVPLTPLDWALQPTTDYFANPDDSYMAATAYTVANQIVVLKARMPSFPNTNQGAAPWASAQVRYWSVCAVQGLLSDVVTCVPDFNAVTVNGEATFVLSTAANRPPNATAADGVNWIEWGAQPTVTILYRQLLASPGFTQSIASAPNTGSLASVMGPYLPQIAYCSEAKFATAGAAGCL